MITVTLPGKTQAFLRHMSNAAGLIKAYKRGIEQGFNDLGKHVVKEARDSIRNGPKTGTIYKINGRMHQASSPGESPANLTGALASGIHYLNRGNELEYGYNSAQKYGDWLENGSPGGKIKKRPNLKPVALKASKEGEEFFSKHIREELSNYLGF